MSVAVDGLHLVALHQHGSNNRSASTAGPQDFDPVPPVLHGQGQFGLCVFLILFAIFVFYIPNDLGDPDNYIPANPMVTPPIS